MTAIDSTVIPEVLAEEQIDAVIENGETYTTRLSNPKIVIMTASYSNSTVLPSASISGRTVTFNLRDAPATSIPGIPDLTFGATHGSPVGYFVLIRGRI